MTWAAASRLATAFGDDVPVLTTAPLRPGFDRHDLSRYGDASWDLGPAVFRENARRCHVTVHFDSVPDPTVTRRLREYLYTRLNVEIPGFRSSGRNHESLSCDNGFAVGGAHEGPEALAFEGCAGRLAAEHVERDAADRGEVARRMVFAGAAGVFAEGHVQDPVQIVLHAPMGAHGRGEADGVGRQRRDEEPGFDRDRAGLLARAAQGEGEDARQPLPAGMALREPGGVGGADRAFLDPAVAGFRLVFMTRPIGPEPAIAEDPRDILLERSLIALQRQDIAGLPGDDLRGDLLLRPHPLLTHPANGLILV